MPKAKRSTNKIVASLHQAIRQAADETANVTPYKRIAERVLAAVQEMNAALKEAHECAEMRIFLSASGNGEVKPLQFIPQIYQMTHTTLAYEVKMQWQLVKDPQFKWAAGDGATKSGK